MNTRKLEISGCICNKYGVSTRQYYCSTHGWVNEKPKIRPLKMLDLVEVESFTTKGIFYVVDLFEQTCTCPHFRFRGVKCKHIDKAEYDFMFI